MPRSPLLLIEKVEKFMATVALNVCIVMAAAVTLIVGAGIVARYVLQGGIPWCEEVSVALMIWIGFFGGSILFYEKSNVYVEFLVKKLNGKVAKRVACIYDLLAATFGIALLVSGVQLAAWGLRSVAPASGIPRLYFYGSVPLGALFIIIFSLAHFIRDLSSADLTERGATS